MSEETSTEAPSEAEILVEKMMAMFGDKIVDPDTQPIQFKYQVDLAKYQLFIESPPAPVAE